MSDLSDAVKVALADTFSFYLKAQGFHWNVEGKDFPQLHPFFGMLYEDAYGAIDPMAEELRALGEYAPASFTRLKELTTIVEELNIPEARTMLRSLEIDNAKVTMSLSKARDLAEAQKKHGLVNFLEDRLDKHAKWGWQLRASNGY